MSHVPCRDVSWCLIGLRTSCGRHGLFLGSRHELRVRISSLDMIGRGVTWQSIRLRSNVTHVLTGLM